MKTLASMNADSFRVDIKVGNHAIVSDEPADKDGDDEGPTPTQLLAASLGACTAMTIRSYAKLKDLPFEGVDVEVEFARRKPSEQKEAGEGAKSATITKVITIKGEKLTNEQRVRMLEIAEKCPVNRALKEGVDFVG